MHFKFQVNQCRSFVQQRLKKHSFEKTRLKFDNMFKET